MSNNIEIGLDGEIKFSKPKDYTAPKMPKKSKEEDIYGMFYDPVYFKLTQNEDLGNDKGSSNEIFNFEDKNYFRSKFVKGDSKLLNDSLIIKDVNVTERQSNEEEQIQNDFYNEMTNEKEDIDPKAAEKKQKMISKTYSKTYGKGFEMMKKLGFKVGSGLGANEQGITDPVAVKRRKGNKGIVAEPKDERSLFVEEEPEDEDIFQEKIDDNYMLNKKRKVKKEESKANFDEFDVVIGKWDEIKHSINSQKNVDFDLLGIDLKKIIFDKHQNYYLKMIDLNNLKAQTHYKDEDLSTEKNQFEDYKEDLIKLMKKTKDKIGTHFHILNMNEDSSYSINYELEHSNIEAAEIHKLSERKTLFLKELQSIKSYLEKSDSAKFSDIDFVNKFIDLYDQFKEDYTAYKGLSLFCINLMIFRLKNKFQFIDYYKEHERIYPILVMVKRLLDKTMEKHENFFQEDEHDYFHIFAVKHEIEENKENMKVTKRDKIMSYFLHKICLEDLVNYIMYLKFVNFRNEWNVRESERLITIFERYEEVIPSIMKNHIFETALIPRLKESIMQWDPLNDPYVHLWVHPWLPIIGLGQLDSIVKSIQDRLENSMLGWKPEDKKLVTVLSPWKKIFENQYWTLFMNKYITPKLSYIVSKLQVNPKNQTIEPLLILFAWKDWLLPTEMSKILKTHFFGKWLNTLQEWLNQSPKAEEIYTWYNGWKTFFKKHIEEESNNEYFNAAIGLIANFLK